MKKFCALSLALALLFSMTGCYGGFMGTPVAEDEVGLKFNNGTTITEVVGPGRYKDWGYTAALKKISAAAITSEYTDSSVLLKDKQSVSIKLAFTVKRARDSESIRTLWSTYNAEARDDSALLNLVNKYVPEGLKAATTSMTLDEVLGVGGSGGGEDANGRSEMTRKIEDNIRPKLASCGIELVDVRLSDISPSAAYLELLEGKAQSQARIDAANVAVAEAEAQRKAEMTRKQTELEVAQLDNDIAVERSKVYSQSPQAFELQRLDMLAKVYNGMTVYVTPEQLTTLVISGGDSSVVPVAPTASSSPFNE